MNFWPQQQQSEMLSTIFRAINNFLDSENFILTQTFQIRKTFPFPCGFMDLESFSSNQNAKELGFCQVIIDLDLVSSLCLNQLIGV